MKNNIKITMRGRHGVLYQKDEDFIEISGEIIVKPMGFMIFESSIDKWENSKKSVTKEEKIEIIKDIEQYFTAQNASFWCIDD